MFELKPLSPQAIPGALAKAERYRLLNEPHAAESICLDILHVDPSNQPALITLILALTDQFGDPGVSGAVSRAQALLDRLATEYERRYYAGIICERRAKALLSHGTPGAASMAYDWLRDAMAWYERAELLRPPGNDDAILRWNACARLLMQNPYLQPRTTERAEPIMLE